MKVLVTFVLALMVAQSFALTQATPPTTPPFKEILRLNCDGSLEVVPILPFGFSLQFPIIKNAVEALLDSIYERAQCKCPELTRSEFSLGFEPFSVLLNGIEGTPNQINSCLDENFPRNLDGLGLLRAESVPSTCTYDSYINNGACNFQLHLDVLSLNSFLQVSFSQCPNTWLPSVSITCSGDSCSDFLKPCSSDSECTDGSSCVLLHDPNNPELDFSDLAFAFSGFLSSPNDTLYPSGCFQSQNIEGGKTAENDIFLNLWNIATDLVYESSIEWNVVSLCVPNGNITFSPGEGTEFFGIEIGDSSDVNLCFFPEENSTPLIGGFFFYFPPLNRNSTIVFQQEFLEWDGFDSEGVYVPTKQFVIPPFEKTPGEVNLVSITCENKIALESSGIGLVFNNDIDELANRLAALARDIVSCGQDPTNKDEIFLSSYGFWHPLFWLSILDENVPPYIQSPFPFPTPFIYNLPTSCTYQRFMNEGICEFDFVGFKELLLVDITIRVSTMSCGTDDLFASWKIQCLGVDCYLLEGLTSCESSSTCAGALECQSFSEIVIETIDFLLINGSFPIGSFASEMSFLNPALDPFFIPEEPIPIEADIILGFVNEALQFIENTDLIELVFSSKYNGDLCSSVDLASFNGTSGEGCFSVSNWKSTAHNIIVRLIGHPTQPTQFTPLHFCYLNLESINDESVINWLLSLVTFDAYYIYLGPAFVSVEDSAACEPSLGFPSTPAGQVAVLNCLEGTFGQITRECGNNGVWGMVSNTCQNCPSGFTSLQGSTTIEECNINIDECETNNGDCATGAVCQDTIGSRVCSCPSENGFPQTLGGNDASISNCGINEYGVSSRECNVDGSWEPETNSCQNCPFGTFSNAGTSNIEGCIEYCASSPCTVLFSYCENQEFGPICNCLPGFSGKGTIECAKTARTVSLDSLQPIARFLFDGTNEDSSGNGNVATLTPGIVRLPIYQRGNPQNEALLLSGVDSVTIPLTMTSVFTVEILFNLQQLSALYDFIAILPSPTATRNQAKMIVAGDANRKIQWFQSNAVRIGVSRKIIRVGITHSLVVTVRDGRIVTFLDNIKLGTFTLNVSGGQNVVVVGRNFFGYIDEISVFSSGIYDPPGNILNNFTECINSCGINQVCANNVNTFTCVAA